MDIPPEVYYKMKNSVIGVTGAMMNPLLAVVVNFGCLNSQGLFHISNVLLRCISTRTKMHDCAQLNVMHFKPILSNMFCFIGRDHW